MSHREVQDYVEGKSSKVGISRGLLVRGRWDNKITTMDEVTDTRLGPILDLCVLSTATPHIHQ